MKTGVQRIHTLTSEDVRATDQSMFCALLSRQSEHEKGHASQCRDGRRS